MASSKAGERLAAEEVERRALRLLLADRAGMVRAEADGAIAGIARLRTRLAGLMPAGR